MLRVSDSSKISPTEKAAQVLLSFWGIISVLENQRQDVIEIKSNYAIRGNVTVLLSFRSQCALCLELISETSYILTGPRPTNFEHFRSLTPRTALVHGCGVGYEIQKHAEECFRLCFLKLWVWNCVNFLFAFHTYSIFSLLMSHHTYSKNSLTNRWLNFENGLHGCALISCLTNTYLCISSANRPFTCTLFSNSLPTNILEKQWYFVSTFNYASPLLDIREDLWHNDPCYFTFTLLSLQILYTYIYVSVYHF